METCRHGWPIPYSNPDWCGWLTEMDPAGLRDLRVTLNETLDEAKLEGDREYAVREMSAKIHCLDAEEAGRGL